MKRALSALLPLCLLVTDGCDWAKGPSPSVDEDLVVTRGHDKIVQFGCASCHTIPGVHGADANVGPSLEHIAGRNYIAGVMSNTKRNMLQWLQDPPAVDAKTAMPKLGLTAADAEDISAYLYTLR